jgi:3-deoxy-manno-octulosonate cytidylyltransferase (CMP-KDO synthetase)
MAKIIGVIPARMASTRFPGKPLAKILGVPMVGHVYFRSKMSRILDDVYVATCDQEIIDYVKSIGGRAIMTSATHERCTDRIAEATEKIITGTGQAVDIIVNIQGDEPLIYPEMLDEVVRPLLKDTSLVATNLMTRIKSPEEHEDPNVVKTVTDNNSDALYFSREPIPSRKKASGQVPAFKQLGVIAFWRDFLFKFNKLKPTPLEIIESVDMLRALEHGYKIRMVPTEYETLGVDTPQGLRDAEEYMKKDPLAGKYVPKRSE